MAMTRKTLEQERRNAAKEKLETRIDFTAMIFPQPYAPFLIDVVDALRKRSKALKFRVKSLICDRVIERKGDDEVEKIELTITPHQDRAKTQIRLHFWEDRWIWIDIRRSEKIGWQWRWGNDGRLTGEFEGRDIVVAIEKTIDQTNSITAETVSELDEIWRALLARGPKGIVQ
jgi:hypothetical protein